jgi:hypothetical protein
MDIYVLGHTLVVSDNGHLYRLIIESETSS